MASLKAAIRQKCKDCTYDPAAEGTWLMQVEACNVKSCALWEVRPLTVNTVNIRRGTAAIANGTVSADLLAQLPDEDEEPAEA